MYRGGEPHAGLEVKGDVIAPATAHTHGSLASSSETWPRSPGYHLGCGS